jgi:hypothetical protein
MKQQTACHLTLEELTAGLIDVESAPSDRGTLEMIVRRPEVDGREMLDQGELDPSVGLVGDSWKSRGSGRTEDGTSHPDMQLNVMNARAIQLIAQDRDRWQLAGDQLYIDLDISEANLPAGTRLQIGDAVIEVTDQPHRGCPKFSARFGADALRIVNSERGLALKLRGVNARVVSAGVIRAGDVVAKL